MRMLIALWFCGSAIGLSAQTQKTFSSPDGLFRFKYPQMLVDCLPVLSHDKAASSVLDSCVGQDPVCVDGAGDAKTIACFGYPKERLQNTRTLVATMFFVAETPAAKTRKDCEKGSPNWLIRKTWTRTINRVSFTVFETEDNWLSGGQSVEVYRTFHGGKCYELGLQTVASRADSEVKQKLTNDDRKQIEATMKQPIRSFVFVK